MSEGPDVTPEDALQVAQRALAKLGEVEDDLAALRADHEDAVEDLTAACLRLSEIDEERSYHDLSRDERIGIVREHAFERATDSGGRAALDYQDIKYGAFDGEPSASYCYDLMRLAAGRGDDAQRCMDAGVSGFRVRDPDGGNIQLAVDAERAKAGRDLLAAKKDAQGSGVL